MFLGFQLVNTINDEGKDVDNEQIYAELLHIDYEILDMQPIYYKISYKKIIYLFTGLFKRSTSANFNSHN